MGHYSDRLHDASLVLGDDGACKPFIELTAAELRRLAAHQSGQIYDLREQLNYARSLLLALAGLDASGVGETMRRI